MSKKLCKCKDCDLYGVELPLLFFSKNKGTEDGLDFYCKDCRTRTTKTNPTQNKMNNNPLKMGRDKKMNTPVWFVYEHIDKNGNVLYRGKGIDGRAYDALARRKPDHSEWCLKQILDKRDYVRFVDKYMLGRDAQDLETKMNRADLPYFNNRKRHEKANI